MKKKIALLTILLSTFLIWGCSHHTVQPYELANGRVVGSIHGVVTDFGTHSVFSSDEVQVSWIVDGTLHSTYTDELGYYSITDLNSGEYVLTFSGSSDYANSRYTVEIPELEDILDCCPATDKDYEHSVTQNVELYKKDAGLRGYVYKKENDQTTSVASGVTVVADYTYTIDDVCEWDTSFTVGEGYNIYPGRYTATTNASGFFTFDSLPSAPSVVLYTMPFVQSGRSWGMDFQQPNLIAGATMDVQNFIVETQAANPFIVNNNFINVQEFSVDASLTATFSKTMNPASFQVTLVNVTNDNEVVECDTSWSGGLTITIDPQTNLVPGTQYRLDIMGLSTDNLGFNQSYTFYTQPGIEFVSTNLERFEGDYNDFPLDTPIEITFSMAVNLSQVDGYLNFYESAAGPYLNISASLSSDQKTVIITPAGDLEPDHTYNLDYRVFSQALDGDYVTGSITFTTMTDMTVPAQVTNFSLNMGSPWYADYNTTGINFIWNTVAGSSQYFIYARDDNKNTDRVRIATITAMDNVQQQTSGTTLPAQFDYFDDDGIQTPFSHGTTVSYYITAGNDAGESALSSAISVSDQTDPVLNLHNQSGSANNSGGGSWATVTLQLDANEYISSLRCTMTEAGGDTTYVLSTDNITFLLNNDKTGATVTLLIPSGQNASGDQLTVYATDSSGNESSDSIYLN